MANFTDNFNFIPILSTAIVGYKTDLHLLHAANVSVCERTKATDDTNNELDKEIMRNCTS